VRKTKNSSFEPDEKISEEASKENPRNAEAACLTRANRNRTRLSRCPADLHIDSNTDEGDRLGFELVESKVGTAETEMDEGKPVAVTARD
jgi:hypothetical protein